MLKVAIFGLSANPPTGDLGHRGIVKYLAKLGRFNEVWILPVYNHFFTKKLIDFGHRIHMCNINFDHLSTSSCEVKVLPIEEAVCTALPQGVRPGTIDTIEYIMSHNTQPIEITLILGKDTFMDLINKKWKESDRLLSLMKFVVVDRIGYPEASIPEHLRDKIEFHEFIPTDVEDVREVSSTIVRQQLACGTDPDNADLYPEVLDYVHANHLFESSSVQI